MKTQLIDTKGKLCRSDVSNKYCILRLPGDDNIVNVIEGLLESIGISNFSEINPSVPFVNCGIEGIRALVVPLVPDQVCTLGKYLADIRDSGAEIPILGVAESSDSFMSHSMSGLLSMAICLDSIAALDSIEFFFCACDVCYHKRALQNYLSKSSGGYWIWDINKDTLEWSDETLEMTLGADANRPQCFSDFYTMLHPLDRDRVKQAVDNHIKYDAPYADIKLRLRKPCGDYGDYLANGHALRDLNDRAMLFVGTLMDISHEETSRKALISSENKYSFLFYEMSEAAVLAEVESGIICEVNRSAERLFGRSRSELLGSHQSTLHPAELSDDAKKLFRAHISALITNKRGSVQLPIQKADGASLNAEISSSLIDVDGKLYVLGIFRKI